MTAVLAIAAGAALTFLPLVFVARRKGVTARPQLPPLPQGSLDREIM